MRKIYDFNLGYWLLRPVVQLFFRNFYSKVKITGTENLPKNQPFIIAPNHQNALMDALAILVGNKKPTVFLARSDIFKNRTIAKILHFMKIMPVYRIRDGYGELDKNEETFQKSIEVLKHGLPFCLMPEGRQSNRRTLLPLVKGMFRIAFRTQEELPDKEVFIIPAGIDYEDYVHAGGHLVVRFGNPISIKSYIPLYDENQAKGLNAVRDELEKRINELIQNVHSETHYEEIYDLSLLAASDCRSLLANLEKRQKVTQFLDSLEKTEPEKATSLFSQYNEYKQLLNNLKLKDGNYLKTATFGKTIVRSLLLLFGLPVFSIGLVGNFIPILAAFPILKKVKNILFKSSFSFVVWMLFFILYYLILLIVTISCCNWIGVCIVIILPFIGRFAFFYPKWTKNILLQWQFLFLKKEKILEIRGKRKAILSEIS